MSVFEKLNAINVNDHIEKKGNLSYLSWAWAWQTLKANYPESNYTVYENDLGFNYHTDGHTAWVKVGVTVIYQAGPEYEYRQEHIEYLPVMDYKNKSVPKDAVTSMAVNTAIQRGLTKAIARHGLGLYIYAGEDVPSENPTSQKVYNTWSKANQHERTQSKAEFMLLCEENDVNRTDIADFLEFVSPGMKENESFNEIVRFLRSPDHLVSQIEMYKNWKIKNA